MEFPFITIASRSTLAQSGSTWWGHIYCGNFIGKWVYSMEFQHFWVYSWAILYCVFFLLLVSFCVWWKSVWQKSFDLIGWSLWRWGVMMFVIGYVAPTICGGSYWKANNINDVDKRTFTTKQYNQKYIYINKYIVKKYYECSKYSLANILVCICEWLLSRCMQVD